MTKKDLALIMGWLRPVAIGLVIFFAYSVGQDAMSRFHILGPGAVMLMSGTRAFEALVLRDVASEKIGYAHHRDYQIQSGLANAAIAITAVAVYVMGWGRYADATIVTTILMFLTFSALNHATIASMERNLKPVNLLRPFMTLLLVGFLLPGHDRGASPVTQQPWSARKASRIINHRGRILGQ